MNKLQTFLNGAPRPRTPPYTERTDPACFPTLNASLVLVIPPPTGLTKVVTHPLWEVPALPSPLPTQQHALCRAHPNDKLLSLDPSPQSFSPRVSGVHKQVVLPVIPMWLLLPLALPTRCTMPIWLVTTTRTICTLLVNDRRRPWKPLDLTVGSPEHSLPAPISFPTTSFILLLHLTPMLLTSRTRVPITLRSTTLTRYEFPTLTLLVMTIVARKLSTMGPTLKPPCRNLPYRVVPTRRPPNPR